MGTWGQCEECKRYDLLKRHECPPKWKIFHEEHLGDDPKIIFAWDYEDAAKNYGKWYDKDDHDLVESDNIIIQVEPFIGGERKTFWVVAEIEIEYYAGEVE